MYLEQSYGTLVVDLPDVKPTEYVNCLALDLNRLVGARYIGQIWKRFPDVLV